MHRQGPAAGLSLIHIYAISNAFDEYPLAVKLHLADLEATYLVEKGTSSVNRR